MNQGTYPLAASMVNQLNRVDVISNNLANANTNGFKQEGVSEGSFNLYLQKAQQNRQQITQENKVLNQVPKIDNKFIYGEVGSVVPTGNDLDFAISEPEVFFKIQDNNGNILYTKDGAFRIVDNQLVNKSGYKVLDNNDNPILPQGDFQNQIALVKTPFTNLNKVGQNNYKILNLDKVEIVQNTQDILSRGAIEKSNVNTVRSMVALIDAQRRFQQSQKAVMGIDELNSAVIDKLGKV
jgi:flagellar basal-body rod protein FlgG